MNLKARLAILERRQPTGNDPLPGALWVLSRLLPELSEPNRRAMLDAMPAGGDPGKTDAGAILRKLLPEVYQNEQPEKTA